MPPVNLKKVGVGVAVGVADVMLTKQTFGEGLAGFSVAEFSRPFGAALLLYPRGPAWVQDIGLASMPLAVRSLNARFGWIPSLRVL